MMLKEIQVPLFDLIMCLSDVADFINPLVTNHQKQVAYIALRIAEELGLSLEERTQIVLAGELHDIGFLSLKDRMAFLDFEFETEGIFNHEKIGYSLIRKFKPLSDAATLIRFHHVKWNGGAGIESQEIQVPIGSHILHLADRIAVLINKEQEVLGQVKTITERVLEQSDKMFKPELVEAFKNLSIMEYFWLDAASPTVGTIIHHKMRPSEIELDIKGLIELARLFAYIIDFRSPFTANHSSGVTATAEVLAKLADFSERECEMMKAAGYLHDLGKLAVPREILEKPDSLNKDEFNVMQSHVYYTYRVLERIDDLDAINTWAAFHHERLDGKGYPFHLKADELPLGSRIMAVADVFTAITEDRSYRKGMSAENALHVLRQMANSALDPQMVSLLIHNFDEINAVRQTAQELAAAEYRSFQLQSA